MERRAIVKLTVLNAEPRGYSRDAYSIISSVGNVIEKEISQENLIDNLQGVDALIVRLGLKINKKIIENSNCLKYIISATTGLDHIDIEVAKENNIEIISLKGEDEFLGKITSTSELTFALMLSLYRKINEAINHVKKGGWDRNLYIGNTIAGKKLGILGFGRIGKHISKYGRAFGCAVGAFDLKKKILPDGVKKFESIDLLFKWSNILCIHIPLNNSTKFLIDYQLLSLLPQGAIVINTSRGDVWDENSVVELLEKGHLGGVATDVVQGERDHIKLKGSRIINYAKENNNLIITPHIGGATKESMEMTEVFIAKKFIKIFKNN